VQVETAREGDVEEGGQGSFDASIFPQQEDRFHKTMRSTVRRFIHPFQRQRPVERPSTKCSVPANLCCG
jgi:hypothetical protein